MSDELRKGLEGVYVTESELSSVDGEAGELIYRGYSIEDLARQASYEEVVYLLWHGDLPGRDDLSEFAGLMADSRAVDAELYRVAEILADAGEHPMAAVRTLVSALSAYEPAVDNAPGDQASALAQGRRVTARLPTVLAAFERFRNGQDPVAPDPDLGHAANFLYMLTGEEPKPVAAETFDMALILHADHGINASTFTAMVIASTLADVYNAITGGVGALAGSLHGGANQDVMEVLFEMDESGMSPASWTEEAIAEDRRIPGWGHRVYKVKDPRAVILQEKLEALCEESGDRRWYKFTTDMEAYLTDEVGLPEKGIAPNVDFYSGSVYDQLGIPMDLYTPIFALSRVGGWVAHILEYQEDNRLIRPRGRYVGPRDQEFISIDDRSA